MKRYALIDLCKPALIIKSDQSLTQDEVDAILEKIKLQGSYGSDQGLLTPNEYSSFERLLGGGYALILNRERMQNDSM